MTPRGAVHAVPERNEVIHSREQRNDEHEPYRDPGDQFNSDDESEKIPLIPAMSQYRSDYSDDLQNHLEFAQVAGLDGKSFGGGYTSKPGDEELAPEHEDHNPGWHEVWRETNKQDESGGNEEFVGHGVEQNSNATDLAAFSSQIAVKSVGDRGNNEDSSGQQLLLTARKNAAGEHPNQEGDTANSAQCNRVRQVQQSKPSRDAAILPSNYAGSRSEKQREPCCPQGLQIATQADYEIH